MGGIASFPSAAGDGLRNPRASHHAGRRASFAEKRSYELRDDPRSSVCTIHADVELLLETIQNLVLEKDLPIEFSEDLDDLTMYANISMRCFVFCP